MLATITVDSLADNTTVDAFTTLREAITTANASADADTIVFASSLFTGGAGTITLGSGLPTIASASTGGTLAITGPGAASLTITANNGNFRVFQVVSGGNATLSGMTVTGVNSTGYGAIQSSGTLAIDAVTVANNYAGIGAAGILSQSGSTLTVTNSVIANNTTPSYGGGLRVHGTTTITNTVISGNAAGSEGGGGLYNFLGTVSISNSTIRGNRTGAGGGRNLGGGLASNGTMTIDACEISENVATGDGGGVYSNMTLTITNSTISGNRSGGVGGGIINGRTLSVTNSTVADNTAAAGGGIYNDYIESTVTIVSTILGDNGGGDYGYRLGGGGTGPGTNGASTNNLVTQGSFAWATTVTSGQLNLGVLQNNGGPTRTQALVTGSAAISSTVLGTPTLDQRGFTRTTADIGAYSYNYTGADGLVVSQNNEKQVVLTLPATASLSDLQVAYDSGANTVTLTPVATGFTGATTFVPSGGIGGITAGTSGGNKTVVVDLATQTAFGGIAVVTTSGTGATTLSGAVDLSLITGGAANQSITLSTLGGASSTSSLSFSSAIKPKGSGSVTLGAGSISGSATLAASSVSANAATGMTLSTQATAFGRIGNLASGTTTITQTGAAVLSAVVVKGDLALTSTGAMTQAGVSVVSVTGSSVFDSGGAAVTLNSAANDFVGGVTVNSSASSVSLRDANALTMTSLSLATNASVTAIAGTTLVMPAGGLSTGTGNIDLQALGSAMSPSGTLTTTSGSVSLYGASGLTIANDITSTSGSISLTGFGIGINAGVTVNAGSGTILLDGNDGSISLAGALSTTSNANNAVVIQDATTVSLGAITTGGTGTLRLGYGDGFTDKNNGDRITGLVTQTGIVTAGTLTGSVAAGATLTAANAIGTIQNLTACSDLTGNFSLSDTGSLLVNSFTNQWGTSTFATTGQLQFHSIATDTRSLSLTGVGVSAFQSNSSIWSRDITVDGGAGAIAMGTRLALNGTLVLNNTGAFDVSANVRGDWPGDGWVRLGTSSIGGNLSLSGHGILQTGVLTVGGNATFTTNVSGYDIDLGSYANDLAGTVTVNSAGNLRDFKLRNVNASAGAVTNLTNAAATQLRDLSIIYPNAAYVLPSLRQATLRNVVVSAGGAITQASGGITPTGTSSFTTGGYAITLTDAANTFGGAVSLANAGVNDVDVTAAGGFSFGAVTTGGDVTITAAGTITVGNPITATGRTVTLDSTGGAVNGTSLITANTVDLNATTGIGTTAALNLAAASISADSTAGKINLANALATAVTVTSLTSKGTSDPSGALLSFSQSGGGTVTFNTVSSAGSDDGYGVISLTNTGLGGGITVAGGSGVTSRTGSTITLQTTQGGNILVNTLIDANVGDGRVELFSDGSISVPGLITGGEAFLQAQTGINVNASMAFGFGKISSPAGDITVANQFGIAVPNAITATGNVTLTSQQMIGLTNPITASGKTVTLTAQDGDIDGGSLITASTVDLNATTGIGTTAAVNLAAFFISADTTSGPIDIDNTSGTSVSVTSLTTSGSAAISFDQTGAGGIGLDGPVTTGTGTITLTSQQGITGTGLITTGGTLNVTAPAGLSLTTAVATLGTISVASGELAIVDAGTLTVAGPVSVGGQASITATGGLMTITGSISNAGSDLTLSATGIDQTGGAITTRNGTISGNGGNVALTRTGNNFTGPVAITNTGSATTAITDANAIQFGAVSVGTGTFTVNSTGNITQKVATGITTGGAVVLNPGTGWISFGQSSNDFGGSVSATTTATAYTVLRDSNSIQLGAISVGSMTVTSVGVTQDASGITVAGNVTFDSLGGAVTLTDADNDFQGLVSVNNSGANNVAIRDQNTIEFGATTLGSGTLAVTAVGITQAAPITQASGAGAATFNGGAGPIGLTNPDNEFTGEVSLTTTGANDAAITDATALILGVSSVGRNLSATATAFSQSGVLTVAGTTTLTITAAATDIDLGTYTNDLAGVVTVNSAANLRDFKLRNVNAAAGAVTNLTDADATSLRDLSILYDAAGYQLPTLRQPTLQNVVVSAGGAITQAAGGITPTGTASFTTGGFAITLTDLANDFGGAVALANTGVNAVAITDVDDLQLAASSVGSGTLTVTAVGITQAGALTQAAGAGTATFNGGAGAIQLTQPGNEFTGAVSLTTTGTSDAAVTDATALILGTSSIGRNLSVAARGISQSGVLTVAGTTTLTATAAATDIDLATQANDLSGAVTVNSAANLRDFKLRNVNAAAGAVTNLTNAAATSLRDLSILYNATGYELPSLRQSTLRNVVVSAGGAITQAGGGITPTGTSSFTTGGHAITLADDANNFGGAVSLSNTGVNDIDVTAAGAFSVGAVTTGGDLTITAAGTITVGNAITANGRKVTLDSTGGAVVGGGLITAGTVDLDAETGIGTTTALSLAAASIAADSTAGPVRLTNALATAVTVSSLTSKGTSDPSGALISFRQSGGGTVTFNKVSSVDSDPDFGVITLTNAGGGITVAGDGVTSAGTTSTISLATTGTGDIAVTAPIDAQENDGNVSLTSAGAISGSGLITGSGGTLSAQTGINVNTRMAQGFFTISSTTGDIAVSNALQFNVPHAINATGDVTFTSGQGLGVPHAITATNKRVTLTALAGDVQGGGLITANTVDLNATSGIGGTTALNLAAFFVSADTTSGAIDIDNTSGTAVSVTSLTTSGSAAISFDQTGGGGIGIDGPVTTGTGTITLTSQQGITGTGLITTGGTLNVTAPAGLSIATQVTTFGTLSVADGSVSITQTGGIDLPAIALASGRTLTIIASGAISQQTGTSLSVPGGSASFTASTANADVILGRSNAFGGTINVSAGGTASVQITDTGSTSLGTLTLGTGTLTVATTGAITQTAAIVQPAGAGAVAFETGAAAITLTNPGNDFRGPVRATNTDANDVAIVDVNAIVLGTMSVGGGLAVTAGSGESITLGGNVSSTNGGQGYVGNLILDGGARTLVADGGAVVIGGTIDSAGGSNYGLTVTAVGDVTVTGAIGGTRPLGNLSVTGNDIRLANIGGVAAGLTGDASLIAVDAVGGADPGSITLTGTVYRSTGTQSYTGLVTLATDATLSGTTPTFTTGVAGAGHDLALDFSGTTVITGAGFTGIRNLSTSSGGGTTLSGAITTSGTQIYADAVTLADDTTLAGTTVTTSSTVTGGGKALSITGNASVGGAISGVTNYSVSGTTSLGAGVTATGTQSYTGLVTLAADTTLTGTTPTFTGGVAGTGHDLALDFSGTTVITGTGFTGIRNLSTGNGGGTTLSGAVTTSGTQIYGDAVTLADDTILAGTTVTTSSTVTGGGKALSITGNASVGGAISGVTNYSVSGTTSLAAGVTTTGTQAYTGLVTLAADTTLSGTTPTFTTGVAGAGHDLALDFSGTTVITGAGFTGIRNLSTSNGGGTTLSGAITTTGTQIYGDAVTLAADTTLSGTTVTTSSTVTGGGKALAITGNASVGGAISGVTNYSVSGTTSLAAGVTTSGTQSYTGLVTLAADATLSGTTPTFTTGVAGAGHDLALDFSGTTVITGAGFTGIRNLSTGNGSGTTLSGAITTIGTQTYGDAVTLAGNTTLTGTTPTFTSGVAGAGHDLALDFSGTTVITGAAFTGIAALTTDAAGSTTLSGPLTTMGNQTFNDDVALAADTTLDAGTGSILLAGVVSGGFALTPLTSGSGTTTLSGANTNTTTNVVSGVVILANSSPQTTAFVVSGGTLRGTGAVGSLTATGTGVLAPGASPGTIGAASLALAVGTALQIEIAGTTAGTGYDQLVVAPGGTVDLGGATLAVPSSMTMAVDTVLTIVDNGGSAAITGTFAGLPEGATLQGGSSQYYRISYVGGTGNDVTLTAFEGDVIASLADDKLVITLLTSLAITELQTSYDATANTLAVKAANSGVMVSTVAGVTVDTATDTIIVDLAVVPGFAGISLVGNAGLDQITIGSGGIDLHAVTTGAASQSVSIDTVAGATDIVTIGGAIRAKGVGTVTIDAAGGVTLAANTTLTAATVAIAPGVTGSGKSLAITGNAVLGGAIAGVTNLLVSGTTSLGAGVATTGTQSYTGLVTLTADATLTGTTPTFSAGVAGAGHDLALDFSGTTVITGSAFTGIRNLSTGNGGGTTLSGAITTSGTQTYGDAVTLAADTTLSGTTPTFTNGVAGAGHDLALDCSGTTVITGAGFTGIRNLSTGNGGGTTLSGAITTSGTQTYGDAVTLAADTTLTGTTPTFSAGIAGAGHDLALDFSGTTVITGAGFTGIRNLSAGNGGGTTLSGAITTSGTQTYGDAVTLADNTTLSGTIVTTSSTVTGGGKSLAITGDASVGGAISGVTNYSVSGTTSLGAGVATTGTQAYTGLVTLAADTTLTGTTPTFTAGVAGAGHDLALDFSGTTVITGAAFTGIAALTTDAAGSTTLSGPLTTTGNQTFNDDVTLAADTTLDAGTGSILLAGVVSGGFALTPLTSGPGTTTLSGANTNATTNVVSGVVILANSSPQTTAFVVSGGTLRGTGTVGSLTTTGSGVVAPGASPGTIGAASLALAVGTALQIEIAGTTAGTGYDQLVVAPGGTVALGGATLGLSASFAPPADTVLTIVDNRGSQPVTGTFAGLAEGAILSLDMQDYRISYVGGTGNDVTLTALQTDDIVVSVSGDSEIVLRLASKGVTISDLRTAYSAKANTVTITAVNGGTIFTRSPGIAVNSATGTITVSLAAIPAFAGVSIVGGNGTDSITLGPGGVNLAAVAGGGASQSFRIDTGSGVTDLIAVSRPIVAKGAGVVSLATAATGATGGIRLAAAVTTGSGAQTYAGPAILAANTAIGSGINGDITFAGTLDGARTLTVGAGGQVRFLGAVGAATPLRGVTVSKATAVTVADAFALRGQGTGSRADGLVIRGGVNNIVFSDGYAGAGRTISGFSGSGIRLAGASAGSHFAGITSANNGTGLRVDAGSYAATSVTGCTFQNNRNTGVTLTNARGLALGTAAAGNIISANANWGIYASGNLSGTQVQNNAVDGNGRFGVFLNAATGLLLGGTAPNTGNRIVNTAAWGAYSRGVYATGNLAGTLVQGNTIRANGGDGVMLADARRITIGGPGAGAGNVIDTNGGYGVDARGLCTGSLVQGNTITGNARGSITVRNAWGIRVV